MIPAFYHNISQFDADAGSWILEQLPEHLPGVTKYRKPLVKLYSSIIQRDHPAASKTLAAANLATVLEEMLVSSSNDISELNLPCEELERCFNPMSDVKQWNRHATDAELRLQGCLLALRASSTQEKSVSYLKNDLQSWVIKLRSALSEETVSLNFVCRGGQRLTTDARNSLLDTLLWFQFKAFLRLFAPQGIHHGPTPLCSMSI